MGGGGVPSGGTYIINGRRGDLPAKNAKPNSRYDLHVNGKKVQSRWYDHEGKAIRNRDFDHQDPFGNHEFPHDHAWEWERQSPRLPENLQPYYESYY